MSLKKIISEGDEEEIELPEHRVEIRDGGVFIPIKEGDRILRGRFKNKKTIVKELSINKHGGLQINGKNVLRFRLDKKKEELESDES